MINTTVTEKAAASNVESGDFLKFRYRDGDGKHSEREVLALAYEDESRLLHALDLDKFSDSNLESVGRELASMSGDRQEFDRIFEDTGEVALDVQDSEVEEWYETEYVPRRFDKNPYRTFREDRIYTIRKVTASIA
jgi:hypothetical protein